MARKLSFALITLFWVTMNALLWRAEFGGKDTGADMPVSLIWEKILTSPDDSGLAVNIAGDRVGYVRWQPNIGEESATGKVANENEIEGRVKKLTGYTIHADGNFILPEGGGRVRFELEAKFAANNQWTEWTVKGLQRPNVWTVSANRKSETIELGLGEGRSAVKQTFRFSDFQNPGKLMDDLGVTAALPMAGLVLPNLTVAPGSTNGPGLSLGLKWEGKQDWLQMGHARVKVYQLRAQILEKYEVVVIVSRVGEILRVKLPGEMTLVNEALINM
ncbi:MAG TPA: hypothetical protein VM680_17810 [Verrucomicrobiae bacterium]|nr:hypothetical protein [Verrucomicrobiae bacterium]